MSKTGVKFWLEHGFAPNEASAFKNITTEGIKDSRAIQVMIETRMRRFREFYQKHLDERNTLDSYYKWVREQYVKNKITDNPKSLILTGDIQRKNKARTLAFDFFHKYRDKYAIKDTSGKLIETPRKKTRASKKPITKNKIVAQLIAQSDEDIKQSKFRLSYAKTDGEKQEWNNRIKRQEDRIKRLNNQ